MFKGVGTSFKVNSHTFIVVILVWYIVVKIGSFIILLGDSHADQVNNLYNWWEWVSPIDI